jgi:hypothetical protein
MLLEHLKKTRNPLGNRAAFFALLFEAAFNVRLSLSGNGREGE